jgi:TorA maturation chaperone TorD
MTKNAQDYSQWKETLIGEMLLLGVLSKLTQKDPERDWLQTLISEDVFSESPLESQHADLVAGLRGMQEWCKANESGISEEHLAALKADYTRIFIGIGKPVSPPWESVYFNEDRMIFQEQTLQVREWYRHFGLEAEKLYHEPDDHVGLELAFLAHLARLRVAALEENNEPEFEQLLGAQRQFLFEHPLTWIPYWCGKVEQHARTDFYRGLAQLIRGSLYTLAERLDVKSPEVRVL